MAKKKQSETTAGITIRLRDDLIALIDHYAALRKQEGVAVSDSGLSAEIIGYRDLIPTLRGWPDNQKSPTLKSLVRLEVWLRDALGEVEYQAFVQRRAALVLPDGGF